MQKHKFLYSLIYGIGAFLCVFLILIPAAAVCLYTAEDPTPMIFPAGVAVLYVSSALGGFFSCLKGESPAYSLLTGLCIGAILFILSLFFKSGISSGWIKLSLLVLFCAIFELGALLCLLLKAKSSSKRRRRRR